MMKPLKNLCIPGVCVLTSDKEVRILSSNNLLNSLQRIVLQLPDNTKYKVYPETSALNRSILCHSLSNELSNKGFNVVTMVPKWSVKIKVREYNPGTHNERVGIFKAYVEVYNSYQNIVVGVFSIRNDAEKFKKRYYPSNKISGLIYANNKETKDLYEMSQMQKRIQRID